MLSEPIMRIEQIVITANNTYTAKILRGLPLLRAAIKFRGTGLIRAINCRFAKFMIFVFLTTRNKVSQNKKLSRELIDLILNRKFSFKF